MVDKHPELRRLAEALLNAVIADQERQVAENKETQQKGTTVKRRQTRYEC